MKHGLIFRDTDDDIWIGVYSGDNLSINEFHALSDLDGVYADLLLDRVALVKIDEGTDDQMMISDICTFEIAHEEAPVESIPSFLEQVGFPSEDANEAFGYLYRAAVKIN